MGRVSYLLFSSLLASPLLCSSLLTSNILSAPLHSSSFSLPHLSFPPVSLSLLSAPLLSPRLDSTHSCVFATSSFLFSPVTMPPTTPPTLPPQQGSTLFVLGFSRSFHWFTLIFLHVVIVNSCFYICWLSK
jgi:hypothetical protein